VTGVQTCALPIYFAFLLRFCVDRGRGGTPARCRPLQSRGPPVSSGGVMVVPDPGGPGGSILPRADTKSKRLRGGDGPSPRPQPRRCDPEPLGEVAVL